ncbi:DUF6602 domain-containing protein [Amycolatopsis thermoflava]
MARSYVEQYWTGVVKRLQAEVDVLNRMIPHNAERGRANEIALAQLLENLLPPSVGVGTGIVIDADGRASNQMDIVIYDKSSQPTLMAQSGQFLFPVEVVFLVVEVKTTFDTDELIDSVKKKKSLHELKPRDNRAIPGFAFIAYNSADSAGATAGAVQALPKTDRPDALCVLNPGLIAGLGRGNTFSPDGDDYIVGLVPLHQLDDDQSRRSQQWEKVENGECEKGNNQVFRNGSPYPTSSPRKWGRDRLVCEPGRALLLYADLLLQILIHRKAFVGNVLGNYLTTVAREYLELLD